MDNYAVFKIYMVQGENGIKMHAGKFFKRHVMVYLMSQVKPNLYSQSNKTITF
jgi:hypothetical protein